MKKLNHIVLLIMLITLISCGSSIDKEPANKKGFTTIEKEMKKEFGNDAYYTKISVLYDKSYGNAISATVTKNPETLKMEEWNYSLNNWKQNAEITLEIPKGTKAKDFMFQLNEKINLSKLGELIKKSREKLITDKKLDNPQLSIAYVKFPKNGDVSKAEYNINLKPKNGGTTFSFYYKLDGELIKMNY